MRRVRLSNSQKFLAFQKPSKNANATSFDIHLLLTGLLSNTARTWSWSNQSSSIANSSNHVYCPHCLDDGLPYCFAIHHKPNQSITGRRVPFCRDTSHRNIYTLTDASSTHHHHMVPFSQSIRLGTNGRRDASLFSMRSHVFYWWKLVFLVGMRGYKELTHMSMTPMPYGLP